MSTDFIPGYAPGPSPDAGYLLFLRDRTVRTEVPARTLVVEGQAVLSSNMSPTTARGSPSSPRPRPACWLSPQRGDQRDRRVGRSHRTRGRTGRHGDTDDAALSAAVARWPAARADGGRRHLGARHRRPSADPNHVERRELRDGLVERRAASGVRDVVRHALSNRTPDSSALRAHARHGREVTLTRLVSTGWSGSSSPWRWERIDRQRHRRSAGGERRLLHGPSSNAAAREGSDGAALSPDGRWLA